MRLFKCIVYCVFFVNSCSLLAANSTKIEFTIKNNLIQDSSFVDLLIRNNTLENYYFPIIASQESEKWRLLCVDEMSKFFFLEQLYSDRNMKAMTLYSDDCLTGGQQDQSEYMSLWKDYSALIGINDIVCLGPGDSVILKVPIHLLIRMAQYCKWMIQDYDYKSEIWLQFRYNLKADFQGRIYLPENTVRELHGKKFRLYTDEMVSNRVKVMPSKYYYPDLVWLQKQDSIRKAYTIDSDERIKKHKELPKGSLQEKYYYNFCQGLTKLERDENYPNYKTEKICSIRESISAISFLPMAELGYNRLKEIAGYYFKKRIYLHLITGVGSVDLAESENRNIKDDHRLIYISIDDCLTIGEIEKAAEVYNTETRRLMGL